MKKIMLFWIFTALIILPLKGQELKLEGVYQGKDLYIQNPMATNYAEFCVQQVYVNDKMVAEKLRTSAFVVRLSHLKVGDPVRVRIIHKGSCQPKVLNPQVIRAEALGFQFRALEVGSDSLRWLTAGEHDAGLFVLERYQEDHWEPLLSREVEQTDQADVVTVPIDHNNRMNRYRVRLVEKRGKVYYSQEKEYKK